MLEQGLQAKVDSYKRLYGELKKQLKWKVSDPRALMLVASMYIINGKPFEMERFIALSDAIKKKAGMFSTLNSYQRFTAAAMLDVRFEKPEEKIEDLLSLYRHLTDGGFSRGAFTYLSALVMLSSEPDGEGYHQKIERSLTIYKGMRSRHFFLTSSSDYPLAVLLTERSEPVEEIMEHIEFFYGNLNDQGFRKGNDLQFLSHILSIDQQADTRVLIERSKQVFDALHDAGIRPKPAYYPAIGLLSLLEDRTNTILTVREIADQLLDDKLFRWHKDMNFMMGVNILLSEKLEDKGVLETGIYTTIEAVIQAQQAALIAAVAGASAASSSNSGS
ncbi:DUF4003 family protein [Bacillus marinisedimentorum]|uniref:DUF4003 family protein n=1 Tax=Bacillus marinisedimentorum TaxID=1821260 RepID=UPI0008731193|nr:DUF4003 family protein [Bacillus marinisedimentorum]